MSYGPLDSLVGTRARYVTKNGKVPAGNHVSGLKVLAMTATVGLEQASNRYQLGVQHPPKHLKHARTVQ